MTVDPQLLEILVCPEDKAALELVQLPETVCRRLVDGYREQFKDEEPIVEEALVCSVCSRVYPIVSDIPVMLVDEALAHEEIED